MHPSLRAKRVGIVQGCEAIWSAIGVRAFHYYPCCNRFENGTGTLNLACSPLKIFSATICRNPTDCYLCTPKSGYGLIERFGEMSFSGDLWNRVLRIPQKSRSYFFFVKGGDTRGASSLNRWKLIADPSRWLACRDESILGKEEMRPRTMT